VSAHFDYTIASEQLYPPLSANHIYGARVVRLVWEDGLISSALDPAAYGITEVWGRTEDEARAKLERRVAGWLAQQGKQAPALYAAA
jgi:hypothetical protein